MAAPLFMLFRTRASTTGWCATTGGEDVSAWMVRSGGRLRSSATEGCILRFSRGKHGATGEHAVNFES
jgi:hypothetical protein